MKVLITGGAGFIGSNLVRHFIDRDDSIEIRVIDDLSTGRLENLEGLAVDFVEGSILDTVLLSKLVDGADAIVHLAAIGSVPRSVMEPLPTHEANATGTLNVLEAARSAGTDYVVVSGSSSVYGSNPALAKSEFDWTRPMSPYAVSKIATEAYTNAYGFSYGMKTLAFRFFNVFGPGQPADHDYAAVIPKFLDAALRGIPLTVHGDGMQTRDFTFVDTVSAILYDAVTHRVESRDPINLAFGTSTSLLELIELIEQQVGHKLERNHVDPRPGDVRASQSDGVRVKETFPHIQPVDLATGLSKTLDWFRVKPEYNLMNPS